MKSFYVVLFYMLALNIFYAQTSVVSQDAQSALSKVDRHFFIENKGQWHSDVLYLARLGGLGVWITKYGVNYDFFKLEEIPSDTKSEHSFSDKFRHKDYRVIGHRVLVKLQGYHENPVREGREKQEGYYNYFIGNDPSKYATFVGLYKEAVIKNVYDGIDVRYYFDGGMLRYDYIVQPGADPNQIVFKLEGSDKTYVDERGNLVFTTRFGEVSMAGLKVYQEKDGQEIAASFVDRDGGWSIEVGNYDKSQALVIDPLIYSTYIGGSDDEEGRDIAVDGSGNAYITGYTRSTNYDVTVGAYQTSFGGIFDVFVTKLNASGSKLVYSTFLGGSYNDYGRAIVINRSGNAYVTGETESTNFPVTAGAYQTTYGENRDVFVTKLNASGSRLVYSTYVGGSNSDEGYGIAVDGSGNAYVTGQTGSENFPVTTEAYQMTYGGDYDVFVTKLNASGSGLVYSTFLGGSDWDYGYDIAVDGSGNAYVTGGTQSTNYPVTAGAYQTTFGGARDVFVTKLNASGNGLVYSTYLGGSSYDFGQSIALDGSGNVYVTGGTGSSNFPVTAGAYKTTKGKNEEAFVMKLNARGNGLMYSTYLGGSNNDYGRAIAIDGSGNVYVTGETESSNFPVTAGAYQTTFGGARDVFVTKLNASGSRLMYSTYLGGIDNEEGYGIAVDGSGNAYVTGETYSTNFPVKAGAYQRTNGGNEDVFVTKLNAN